MTVTATRTRRSGRPPRRKLQQEKARRGRQAALKVFFCLLLGAGLGLAGRYTHRWMQRSPLFTVREVVVTTGPKVSEPVVRRLSGVAEGRNIFTFDLAGAVRDLEVHPWVRHARITRQLPDRVDIRIEERQVTALAALGELYYVDQAGEVFKRVLPGEPLDYPVITGLDRNMVINDRPAAAERINTVRQVLAQARRSRVLPEAAVSEAHWDETFGVTLYTAAEGLELRMGAEEFPVRWARLEKVLVQLAGDLDKVERIDLSFQDQATVKLRPGYKVAMN